MAGLGVNLVLFSLFSAVERRGLGRVASAAPGQGGPQEERDRQTGERRLPGHRAKPRQRLSGPLGGLDRRPQPVDGNSQTFGYLFDRTREICRRVDGALRDARRGHGLRYFVVHDQNSRKRMQRQPPLAIRACACLEQRARRPLAIRDRRRCERRVAASSGECWTATFVPPIHSLCGAFAGCSRAWQSLLLRHHD